MNRSALKKLSTDSDSPFKTAVNHRVYPDTRMLPDGRRHYHAVGQLTTYGERDPYDRILVESPSRAKLF